METSPFDLNHLRAAQGAVPKLPAVGPTAPTQPTAPAETAQPEQITSVQPAHPAEKPTIVTVKAFIRATDRLLVVRDKPNPSVDHWTDLWGLPGGRVNYGEQPIAALLRQLEEELGVAPAHIRIGLPLLAGSYTVPSGEFVVFLGYQTELTSGANITLGDELSEWQWATRQELANLPFGELSQIVRETYWTAAEKVILSAVSTALPAQSAASPTMAYPLR